MSDSKQNGEIKLVSKGDYSHWHFKVAYVFMTLIIEDDGSGWLEEEIIERFKEVGVGAPQAYAPMDYIDQLQKDGHVTSKIEKVGDDPQNVRCVYRPAKIDMFMRVEKT